MNSSFTTIFIFSCKALAGFEVMAMKKIVVFGASGQVGLKVCEEASKRGLLVRAVSRDPTLYPEELKSKVDIVKGDVTNIDDVKNALKDQEAVIVTLGTRNDLGPTTALSQGMQNIIDAMKLYDIKTISVCLSAFLFYEIAKVPQIFKDINDEHLRMFNVLKESGLNWIAVYPPHFTDVTSPEYTVKHDSSPGRTISKIGLASFMIDCLQQPEHYQRVCGITQKDTSDIKKT